jgi:hypothetical protein
MLKKITIGLALLTITANCFAQDNKKESEVIKTKMDVFTSKTGTIIKFTDYKLESLKAALNEVADTRIREVKSGSLNTYFLQIIKVGKFGNTVASIEYADLLELIKALSTLKADAEKDLAINPEFIEKKFISVDGFHIGYYIRKGSMTWYLKLEKYGSDNTLIIDNGEKIEKVFNDAKTKIDELNK